MTEKIAIWASLHNFVGLYLRITEAFIDNQKKIVKQQYLLYSPHNMVNVGPLTAEIGSKVWGTPANFSGFRMLASLLQRRRSADVNQTLHDVWPSPALVHYIYIFLGSYPVTQFYQVQNSVYVQVVRSPTCILAALLHGTRVVGVSQALQR